MSLVIAHNMMAQNAAMNLGRTYGKLSTSVQRLSSGYRINSAADDAAGLAIRELMRTDIRVTQQGLRNAADGISMIQTADGALGVIDEKLTRMKELAEQAATGTYTTVQRDIINSEYQAMAKEIDRIASATNFNGIKLLDGSVSNQHGGDGLKIHFGVGNKSTEDYYYVNMGDARATTSTGLMVGGDGKNDIWSQAGSADEGKVAKTCCNGFNSMSSKITTDASGSTFTFGYNWDRKGEAGKLNDGKHTAGVWKLSSSATLQDLVNAVNKGTQSRVKIDVSGSTAAANISAVGVCLGESDIFYVGGMSSADVKTKTGKNAYQVTAMSAGTLASAINSRSKDFIAIKSGNSLYVFNREGGNHNNLKACEMAIGTGSASLTQTALNNISFTNVATGAKDSGGAYFSLGGENWGTMKAAQVDGYYDVSLNGGNVGKGYDLNLTDINSKTSGIIAGTTFTAAGIGATTSDKLKKVTFAEIQDAADGAWAGAEVRTQSSAQKALDAITNAIVKKDKIRADLGALQNRLENTMTNLSTQAYNLQASESRISDVDMAVEMTAFTKNNVLAQAATSMLAQANSLSNLALQLIR